jgi:excinuclease UvrABC nuclease subunit
LKFFVQREAILAAASDNRYQIGMDSREAFIALNMIEHVGPVRARLLLEHFGDAPKILAAAKSELLRPQHRRGSGRVHFHLGKIR